MEFLQQTPLLFEAKKKKKFKKTANKQKTTDVLRQVIKYLPALKNLSHEERLQALKLPTLKQRRLRGNMIETYKLMTGKYDYEIIDFAPKTT